MVRVKNKNVKRISLCDRFPTGPTAEVNVWGCGSSQDSVLLLELPFLREPKAHCSHWIPTFKGLLAQDPENVGVASHAHFQAFLCCFLMPCEKWKPLSVFWKVRLSRPCLKKQKQTCSGTHSNLSGSHRLPASSPPKGGAHKEYITLHSFPPQSLSQLSSSYRNLLPAPPLSRGSTSHFWILDIWLVVIRFGYKW